MFLPLAVGGGMGIRMRIEYEDRQLLVVFKEAGLPVQTGRTSRRDLVSLLKNHLAQESAAVTDARQTAAESKTAGKILYQTSGQIPGAGITAAAEPYLGIVHRLDQPVEGLLVFAKTQKSAAALSAQAASKDPEGMEKIYQALVCPDAASYPMVLEGRKKDVTLVDWLGRDRSSNMAYVTSDTEKEAKRAELKFRTLWIREGRALLEIRLLTGRHHQIRIQMAHAGMPLLGDRKYGNAQGREGEPLCLCASRLSFVHPATKEKLSFRVEPTWLPLIIKDATMNAGTDDRS